MIFKVNAFLNILSLNSKKLKKKKSWQWIKAGLSTEIPKQEVIKNNKKNAKEIVYQLTQRQKSDFLKRETLSLKKWNHTSVQVWLMKQQITSLNC